MIMKPGSYRVVTLPERPRSLLLHGFTLYIGFGLWALNLKGLLLALHDADDAYQAIANLLGKKRTFVRHLATEQGL